MHVYVVNTSSGEKSKSSQKHILNQIRSLNQLRFIMLTRSQDCVSHHGLVLHKTPTSESTKSTRSCFGADIEVAGVGSFLDSCLPVGTDGGAVVKQLPGARYCQESSASGPGLRSGSQKY